MSDPIIITISRQPGCGGGEIGQRLARRLSAEYIDKKTLSRAAEGYEAAFHVKDEEKGKKSFWDILGRTPILQDFEYYIPEMRSIVSDAEVHEKENEFLLELAGDGPAVVVGRAGFYRFRGKENAVHIFLSGEREYRIGNYARLFGLNREDAEKLLDTTDEATERYIHTVTGRDLLDVQNFDLTINVTKMDFNLVVELILDYIHYRFQHPGKGLAL
jgi:cytidylate kinase